MILKKENRSKYTSFHYWAEGYRHNTIHTLANDWELSLEENQKLISDLATLETKIFDFWIRCYYGSEANLPEYYLDAIVREIVRFDYQSPYSYDQPAPTYAIYFPNLRCLDKEIEERLDTWDNNTERHDSVKDYDTDYLYKSGYGNGLTDAEALFYKYDLSYTQLCNIREQLKETFKAFLEETISEIETEENFIDKIFDCLDDRDNGVTDCCEYDDDEEMIEARENIEDCKDRIKQEIRTRYGTKFPEDLKRFPMPNDLRQEIMSYIYGENWSKE